MLVCAVGLKHSATEPAIHVRWLQHLAALAGYLLISIWLTWPLAAHWNSAYVAYLEEAGHNAWNIWWVRQALAESANPYWTDLLFVPEGVQLYAQTFNIVSSLLTMPIAVSIGVTAAHNTAVLLAFVLTGYGGFVLARHYAGPLVAFLCGALLTAGPYHMIQFEINHLNILSIQWLPLYLWALVRLDERPTPRWAVIVAALFVLNALTDWYWALISSLATGVWWLSSLLRREGRMARLGSYTLAGALIVLALAPIITAMLRVRGDLPGTDLSTDAVWRDYIRGFSSDAFGLFVPNMLHPLWGPAIRPPIAETLARYYSPSGWYVAAGWTLLLCAAVGVAHAWRRQWQWLLLGGVAWAFSLGPTLRVLGYDTGLPMPYTLVAQIELISTARKPSHFAYLCLFAGVVFAALGLQRLSERLAPAQRNALLLGVAGLALFELWPAQQPVHPIEQPAIVAQISERPGVVADLPLERTETSRALRNQMIHGQPIIGGYVSRMPAYESLRYDPLIAQIGLMQAWEGRDIVALDLAPMQCATQIRHVLVRQSDAGARERAGLEAVLTNLNGGPLAPAAPDAQYHYYELPLYPEACRPYLFLGAGWWPVETDAQRVWRWAAGTNDIWLVNPAAEAAPATLTFRARAYETARPATLHDGERRLATWEVAATPRTYRVHFTLPPGRSRFQLSIPADLEVGGDRELSIVVEELRLDVLQ